MHKKFLTAFCVVAFLGMLGTLVYFITEEMSVSGVELLGKVGGGNNGGGNGGGGGNGNNGGGNGGGGGNGNNGGGNGGGNGGNNGGGNGGGTGGGDGGSSGGDTGGSEGDTGSGGDDGGGRASIRSRGIAQHAAVMHMLLKRFGLHTNAGYLYTYHHENIHPAAFASQKEEAAWGKKVHEVSCRMYTYLKRQRDIRPNLKNGYIDWITGQVAQAIGEDPDEVRAALLGYPHSHAHTSAALKNLGEAGCAAQGSQSAIKNEDFAEQHALHEHVEDGLRFTILDQSTDAEIAFRIMSGAVVFTDYGISHTKEMHLLIVRDDLRQFLHVHPERDTDGTWHIPYSTLSGGTYWLFADFVDANMEHYTVRFIRTYAGEPGETGIVRDTRTKKNVGKYTVQLEEKPYSNGTLFTYHIADVDGNAPYLETYLGALGHSIVISPKGDFIHTPPSPTGDYLTFHITDPADDFYRIFTQFQVQEEVLTVEFDWTPETSHIHP